MKRPLVLVAALLLAGSVACRKPKPETPAAAATLPPLSVSKAGAWLFTYADQDGRFVTVDDPKAVPEQARAIVRVTDPAKGQARRDGVSVYVVDVNELLSKGTAKTVVQSREGFETAALAQLPPGESSAFPPLIPGGPAVPPAASGSGGAPPAATPDPNPKAGAEQPVVILYGTSWCGACRSAREYLRQRRIPFADKDIERDPVAARELREKAARLKIPADRVPILDVRGRLLIGFDKARLEALLGEAT